jgi:hypothetical protein
LVTVVQHWRPYLLGHTFTVRTDHQALKFLLEQRVGIVFQQRWLSKLLGYDFVIEYKKGRDNKVTDALSRLADSTPSFERMSLALISFPTSTWVSELKGSYSSNPHTSELLLTLQQGDLPPKGYSLQQGLILRKGRLWIVKDSPF